MIERVEIVLSNGDKCFIRMRFNDLYKQLIIEEIKFLPNGKKTAQSYNFNDDYDFRQLNSFEARYQYKLKKYLEYPNPTKKHLLDALTKRGSR